MRRAFVVGVLVLSALPYRSALAEPPTAADVLGGKLFVPPAKSAATAASAAKKAAIARAKANAAKATTATPVPAPVPAQKPVKAVATPASPSGSANPPATASPSTAPAPAAAPSVVEVVSPQPAAAAAPGTLTATSPAPASAIAAPVESAPGLPMAAAAALAAATSAPVAPAPAAAAVPAAAPVSGAAAPAAEPQSATGALVPTEAKVMTDPTVVVAADDPDLQKAATVKAGSVHDKRPAKKLFGAAKGPAALATRSIGFYTKGCLAGGRELAIDGPAWQAMRLSRNRNWGHPKLVALLERFAKDMKEKEQWPGLLVGDISQPRGGPMLTGHRSHQVGLDADIWFRPMPEKRFTKAERETAEPLLLAKDRGAEVIAGNYNDGFMRLVRRAAKYPEIERVLVHPAIKKAFCTAAGEDRDWLKKVRPISGHNYHFHVRIRCPGDSPTCVAQPAVVSDGDGCGKELDDWIALISKPPKPAPPPTTPVKPAKPKPPLMLKDLPPECTEVVAAADPKPVPASKPPAAVGTPAKPNPVAAQQ